MYKVIHYSIFLKGKKNRIAKTSISKGLLEEIVSDM